MLLEKNLTAKYISWFITHTQDWVEYITHTHTRLGRIHNS